MIYEMKLDAVSFDQIVSGRKTVELRLFETIQKQLNIGDKILFEALENRKQRIAVVIQSLHRYATFEDLFMHIPFEKCGIANANTPNEAATKMNRYYTKEKISRFGVIGIEIKLINLERVLIDIGKQKETEFERFFPDGMK